MSHYPSQSPPPLRHPVPTHPAYIPEPPSTPSSPQGYRKFSSSPALGQQPPQGHNPAAGGAPPYVPAYAGAFQAPSYNHMPPQQQGGQYAFGVIFPSTTVKHHFNVSNSYVMHKIKLELFPWLHKPWARRTRRTEHEQHEWQPPRPDINSPDLYIPAMAIVTYILLTGLHAGLSGPGFCPQILGESASRATLVVLFDFLFVKLGCYILNIQGSSQFVDVSGYSGYKFVGVIFAIAASFVGIGGALWTVVFVYVFLANAFFLLRSLRSVVLPDPSNSISSSSGATTTATVNPAQRRRKITFLFLEAVSQIVYMAALVRLPTA
ncbi:hypothetical protein H1R20_g11081, partial [Candolleomyces eurysporus]